MRVSRNAVRLAALVAAATASGYLWRAALESPSRTTIIRLAPRSTPPRVQIVAAAHDPITAAAPTRRAAAGHPARHQPARRPAQVTQRVALPAQTASFASTSQPAPAPAPAQKPTPKPKPAPKPSAPPPPTPTQSQPQPAAAPAVPTPPAATSAPPADASGSTKPGWGNGDKNHDHGGPPGDDRGK